MERAESVQAAVKVTGQSFSSDRSKPFGVAVKSKVMAVGREPMMVDGRDSSGGGGGGVSIASQNRFKPRVGIRNTHCGGRRHVSARPFDVFFVPI